MEIFGTRLSDVMQAIFLFFTASRFESVWDSYDSIWDCTRHVVASHRGVKNFVASAVDIVVGTYDNCGNLNRGSGHNCMHCGMDYGYRR